MVLERFLSGVVGRLLFWPVFLSLGHFSQKAEVGANPTTDPDHTLQPSENTYLLENANIEWFEIFFVMPRRAGSGMKVDKNDAIIDS